MVTLLNKLGVPAEVQAFFDCDGLRFEYGDKAELFAEGFHYVPTTSGICRFGSIAARLVILSHSIMEAVAYLTSKRHRYPDLDAVACIALGNLPVRAQLKEVSSTFCTGKFILLFGNDLPGKAMDIFVACALRGNSAFFELGKKQIVISCNGRNVAFEHDNLSLHAFQKAFGIRTLCRTEKSKGNNTFLIDLLRLHD